MPNSRTGLHYVKRKDAPGEYVALAFLRGHRYPRSSERERLRAKRNAVKLAARAGLNKKHYTRKFWKKIGA